MNFKRIFEVLCFLPNVPFYVILFLYVIIKIIQNSGLYEFLLQGDDILSEDMIEYLDRIYPKHLEYFIAFIFYSSIILHLIF